MNKSSQPLSPGQWNVIEGADSGGWIRIDAGPHKPNGDVDLDNGGQILIDDSFEMYAYTEDAQDEIRANFYLWGAAKELLEAARDLDVTLGKLIAADLVDLSASDEVSAAAIAERLGALNRAIAKATTIPPKPDYQEPADGFRLGADCHAAARAAE